MAPPDTTVADHREALMETIIDDEGEQSSEQLELLEDLAERPLDVNTASAAELAAIPAITPRLGHSIVEHRRETGPFRVLAELLAVPGMTSGAYRDALPFLKVSDIGTAGTEDEIGIEPAPRIRQTIRVDVLQRVQRRLQRARGYEPVHPDLIGTPDAPTRYMGSPERIYTRVRGSIGGQYHANVTMEKDPGEAFKWDPQNGFYGYDFFSAHLAVQDVGPIEMAVLGDFVGEFGQGVTLWRASGFGKGREPVRPLVRHGRGIRPYASTDENRFFRGAAATVRLAPQVVVSGFASRRHYDARFDEVDSRSAQQGVIGMPITGLHRTPAEVSYKNVLGQTLLGAAAELQLRQATVGAVAYRSTFDAPLMPGEQAYQRFQFAGTDASMIGLYGNASIADYYFFGEAAHDPGGSIGGIVGVETSLGPLQALIVARHYPRDFTSLHGYAFGERNGVTQNETGVYLGARLRASPRWSVSAFFDQFRFPWVRFGVPRPSAGNDAMLVVEHRLRPWVSVYAQARFQQRETGAPYTSPTGAILDGLHAERRSTVRLQGDYQANRDVRFRSRIEFAHYVRGEDAAERGLSLFHDVRWAATRHARVDVRLTYFDTDSFGTRLYQFENDLAGVLTNALLYGRGVRSYVLLGLRPSGVFQGIDARLKVAATVYRHRHTIGSGLDEVEGNRATDIGLQLRYRF